MPAYNKVHERKSCVQVSYLYQFECIRFAFKPQNLNLFEQECIDLNHRGNCLNKGNKNKCDFAIMPLASKEGLLGCESSFDCCKCQGSS